MILPAKPLIWQMGSCRHWITEERLYAWFDGAPPVGGSARTDRVVTRCCPALHSMGWSHGTGLWLAKPQLLNYRLRTTALERFLANSGSHSWIDGARIAHLQDTFQSSKLPFEFLQVYPALPRFARWIEVTFPFEQPCAHRVRPGCVRFSAMVT